MHWLNEILPADMAFYLLQIEAYRIGDSAPAPKFTVVAGPTREARQAGEQKKELAERHLLRMEFWKQLLDTPGSGPAPRSYVAEHRQLDLRQRGRGGFAYNYTIRMEDAQVEVYIDRGDAEQNKQLFDRAVRHNTEIEAAFGEPLEWQRLDAKRASRVRLLLAGGGLLISSIGPDPRPDDRRDDPARAGVQARDTAAQARLAPDIPVYFDEGRTHDLEFDAKNTIPEPRGGRRMARRSVFSPA